MLEAVFQGHTTFPVIAVLMTAAVCAVSFAAVRRRSDRPALLALWAASISGTLFLTLWTTGGSQMAPTCLINKDVLEPLTELQGRLNAALFVPVGLLGTLVMRRLLPAAATGAALSALIEIVQGAFPAPGRACDTSDLVANSLGAVAGAAAGYSTC